jgi:cobalt-precorrin-5B (C1)-methyltransferase
MQDHKFLHVKDLAYSYTNGHLALQGINCQVYQGEFVVILGANGSGKTTLMMLMQGLLAPSQGEITLGGLPVLQIPEEERLRRVGFSFQDRRDQLFATTVYADVSLGPVNSDLPADEVKERVRFALEAVDIWNLRNCAPHQLSFGQQKKAALAGVLALSPELLLLDEPMAGLDPAGASDLMKLLRDLNQKQGLTILMATHDVDLIPLWTDQVIILEKGQLISQGSPMEVFRDPSLVRAAKLRLPRIAHLFEKLSREDNISLPRFPLTVGEARQMLTGYRRSGGKFLRRGYTTGTCAAAAARAAASVLLGEKPEAVSVQLPGEYLAEIRVAGTELQEADEGRKRVARAWVLKDAGDDPDVTNGARIEAAVRFIPQGIEILGGLGVGVVTKPGLAVPPGQPAINPVPRQMIYDNVSAVLPSGRGLEVTISVPEGERLAHRTMNPQLGIIGGISILGTTGIVEPMSEEAFKLALIPQLQIARGAGENTLLLTPGRRGVRLATGQFGIPSEAVIMVSNYFGYILDECRKYEFKKVLLWGHLGKLAKIAAGSFQTYNRIADGRGEVVTALAALRGAGKDTLTDLLAMTNVEGMVKLLHEAGLDEVWPDLAARASRRAVAYSRGDLSVGTVLFSGAGEVLGWDDEAVRILEESGWNLQKKLQK